jgi:hypothetical protein
LIIINKTFFPILAVALFYSCFSERDWDNPYDPESNIDFIKPEITSIQTIDWNKVQINWLKKDTLYTIVKLERATTHSTGAFTAIKEWQANDGTGVDSGVVFGQEYFYRILGLVDEVEGRYSEIASATVAIPSPTNLSAEALNDQAVKLTWDEPGETQARNGQASGPQGKKQIVIEKKHKSQDPIAGKDLESGILKRNGVAEETTNDKPNKKGLVGKGSAKKEMPDTSVYKKKPGGTSNALRALGRTFSGESFIDGYVIERDEGNGSFSVIDSVSNTGQYNDSGLLYGPTYKYRVYAYADQYKSVYVTVDSVSTIFPMPTNLTVTATSDQSSALSWSDNCSFEDGYELWRKSGSGSYEIIDSTAANGTMYADSGLIYGQTYTYKVRAFTQLNLSHYADEKSVIMSIPAPSGLIILQGDDTAILNWTDNSSFETGFSIEKSVEAAPFSEIGTVAGNTINYTDTDVDAISEYRYRVRAFTENNYSDYSEEAEFSIFTGDIFYISPTGSDFTGNGTANYPYKTIQKGIDVAADSSLVLVADGTYNESIDYSGKELTVASYLWLDNDTSHISATTIYAVEGRVVNIDANGSELLGLTVTSGEDQYGSGIYASDQVTISNCIIAGNSYTGGGNGGGIYCANNSEVTISNCIITGNSITGSLLTGIGSHGAGVYCGSNTTVNFTDCTITGNSITGINSSGAGISAEVSSALTLSNCVVNENAIVGENAAGAGVFSVGATLDITDSDISGNMITSENTEGMIGFEPLSLTFTNCGASGRFGPSQSYVNASYSGTSLSGQVLVENGIQVWIVPFSGMYTIEAWGAQGGHSTNWNVYGGYGARMKGDFLLSAGTPLKILVGQQGTSNYYDGGGGGGTFVTTGSNSPLIIAAGGGGGAPNEFAGSGQIHGGIETNGSSTNWANGGSSGSGGQGSNDAGGGGGIN